jgi:hypothetical protein
MATVIPGGSPGMATKSLGEESGIGAIATDDRQGGTPGGG